MLLNLEQIIVMEYLVISAVDINVEVIVMEYLAIIAVVSDVEVNVIIHIITKAMIPNTKLLSFYFLSFYIRI